MEKSVFHIVLADDDKSDRLIFKEAIEESKMSTTIHMVNDGIELMSYLATNPSPLPHIIFLDLNMPRKNGLDCLKEIRRNQEFSEISIAIYSTSGSENDINETFLLGANVYIKKPSDFGELKQVLIKAISAAHQYHKSPFSIENFLLKM